MLTALRLFIFLFRLLVLYLLLTSFVLNTGMTNVGLGRVVRDMFCVCGDGGHRGVYMCKNTRLCRVYGTARFNLSSRIWARTRKRRSGLREYEHQRPPQRAHLLSQHQEAHCDRRQVFRRQV